MGLWQESCFTLPFHVLSPNTQQSVGILTEVDTTQAPDVLNPSDVIAESHSCGVFVIYKNRVGYTGKETGDEVGITGKRAENKE